MSSEVDQYCTNNFVRNRLVLSKGANKFKYKKYNQSNPTSPRKHSRGLMPVVPKNHRDSNWTFMNIVEDPNVFNLPGHQD